MAFPRIKKSKKTIYLDYAATTPLDSRVLKAMKQYWQTEFGNPSSLYKLGKQAKLAIEESRKSIAQVLGCTPAEIIFTAGGTESVNLAILGLVRPYTKKLGKKKPHIITTAIEHHAVLECVEALKSDGCTVSIIGVDEFGFVDIEALKKALRPETVLVSVMYANNEIGTIEPLAEIGKLVRKINDERFKVRGAPLYFHTDACQAAGSLPINVHALGVDLLSVNGSKIYGPKQTGFLYVRRGIKLWPLTYGGGQEHNLRSGTENVPGIVGLAKALELTQKSRELENRRLFDLRNYFVDRLFKKVNKISLNGPGPKIDNLRFKKIKNLDKSLSRLPSNINVSFEGVEGEMLVLYLDAYNIAASTGSACTSETDGPSHVLLALGRSAKASGSSVRFTLGKYTTKKDIDYTIKVIESLIPMLRKIKN